MRSSFGALAQLGERNTGSVEVSGSIPLGSTKYKKPAFHEVGFFCAGEIGFIVNKVFMNNIHLCCEGHCNRIVCIKAVYTDCTR